MPSSEKVISPGVFTNEVDQTFLPAAIGEIGAALIGPTSKGPAGIPTVVQSYSEFQARFGDTFKSGSDYYQYFTSLAAKQYLKHGSNLTVIRVLAGSYSGASGTISSSIDPVIVGGGTKATASFTIKPGVDDTGNTMTSEPFSGSGGDPDTGLAKNAASMSIGGVEFVFTGSLAGSTQSATRLYVKAAPKGSITGSARELMNVINNSASLHQLEISASVGGDLSAVGGGSNIVTMSFNQGGAFGELGQWYGGSTSGSGWSSLNRGSHPFLTSSISMSAEEFSGGRDYNNDTFTEVFKLHTLADGEIMNSDGPIGTQTVLQSGSKDNLRWEISTVNTKKGTFTLLIRRGDDIHKRKQTLETWNNLTLDENASNYIGKLIGDQKWTLRDSGGTDPYLQLSGSYPNKSKYVRVEVKALTTDYLDENGNIRVSAASASLPSVASGSNSGSRGGSFSGGSDGTVQHPKKFYDTIADTNSQGLNLNVAASGKTSYEDAINLLGNQDEYDINLLMMPGVVDAGTGGGGLITKAIDMAEDRGDCFVIADPTFHDSALSAATNEGEARDSSYGAMYYPWVQIPDPDLGKNVWVPPTVVMGGVYAFNDKVAHPWFAPAGLNRGGIDIAIQAERKLTHSNRDTLYESNVNPIATFPGQGVTVWGQKTLQKKASALDRVNVRRLLIKVKKFIASTSRFLVFEQNNVKTRKRFLNMVNPYLEQVQSNSGLNAFRAVMDETNNTPDIVDRNILYGQLFLQPTRTAEFIVLDFTVQPTGATFPE